MHGGIGNRGQELGRTYSDLKGWKEALDDGAMDREIAAGKKALTVVFRARVCVRRSGRTYDQFRRDLSNGYIARSREQPIDIVEANRQMKYYRPLHIGKRKSEDVSGSQHVQDGEKEKFTCYRCERSKPQCNGARNCTFSTKADGTAVNSQEVIATKIQEMQAERQRRRGATRSVDPSMQFKVV